MTDERHVLVIFPILMMKLFRLLELSQVILKRYSRHICMSYPRTNGT